MRILSGPRKETSAKIRVEGGLTDSEGVRLVGSVVVELNVERAPNEATLDGEVSGKQWLVCGRSLEEFEHPFVIPLRIKVCLDPHCNSCELDDGEDEEYLIRINPTAPTLDLSECIRQQILLNQPINPTKNPDEEFQWSLQEEGLKEESDPRWRELEKLKKRFEKESQAEGQ